MPDLDISIDKDQAREILVEAIKQEGIKACKSAIADNEIRSIIREAFNRSYGEKSAIQTVVEQNVSSSVSAAVWRVFEIWFFN